MHLFRLGVIIPMAAIFCFYLLASNNKNLKKYVLIVFSVIFFISFFIFCSTIIFRLSNAQVWDFTAFYLYGKVAASGHNFYLPANFHTVFNSLTLPPLSYRGFIEESVNVGFLYPPPTILLFTPLGFLSYQTALICWTIFIILFAIGSIYLIYDLWFKKYKLNGLMLVAILFFILEPVRSTIFFSQTNFIALFLLLLMYKYAHSKYAGIILMLALFTKPYMIIFGIIFIIIKNWKAIIYFIISAVIAVAATFAIFGKDPFITYIFDNPSKHLPDWVFSESINESLHAVLIRQHIINLNNPSVYTFISIAILLLTGLYLIYLTRKKLYDYIWATLLIVALLIYPGTLDYYGVLLLFIVSQFYNKTNQLSIKNIYFNIIITGIFYYLTIVSVFSAIIFLLLIVIFKSILDSKRNTGNSFFNYGRFS